MRFAASDSGCRAPRLVRDQVATAQVDPCPGRALARHTPPRPSWADRSPPKGSSVVHQLPYCEAVDFSVLGPLRVEDATGLIEIRGGKERLLLARLVAASGRLVTTSDLIDTLWDDDPPASAAKSVQTFVLRLRNALEPDRRGTPTLLLTEGPGYRLAVAPGQVDAERFTHLAAIGQGALADGRPESAGRTLTEALALWRGPRVRGFRRRLRERRGPSARGDAAGGHRGPGRRRPCPGPCRSSGTGAGTAGRGAPAPRAPVGDACQCPLQHRAAGGRPRRLRTGSGAARRRARCWSRIRSQVCPGTGTQPRPHPGPADDKEHAPARAAAKTHGAG